MLFVNYTLINRCNLIIWSYNFYDIHNYSVKRSVRSEEHEYFREYYDEIEVCMEAEEKHFKAAHQIRNRAMADRSDIIIFYVDHNYGGAFQTLQYAKNNKMTYINLWDKVKLVNKKR